MDFRWKLGAWLKLLMWLLFFTVFTKGNGRFLTSMNLIYLTQLFLSKTDIQWMNTHSNRKTKQKNKQKNPNNKQTKETYMTNLPYFVACLIRNGIPNFTYINTAKQYN